MTKTPEKTSQATAPKMVSVWRKDKGHEQVPETDLQRYLESGWRRSSTRKRKH